MSASKLKSSRLGIGSVNKAMFREHLMTNSYKDLLNRMANARQAIHNHEQSGMMQAIEFGRMILELAELRPQDWLEEAQKHLGMDEQTSRCYAQIGEKWPDRDQASMSELLGYMPIDITILGQLTRLDEEKLRNVRDVINLRNLRFLNRRELMDACDGELTAQNDVVSPSDYAANCSSAEKFRWLVNRSCDQMMEWIGQLNDDPDEDAALEQIKGQINAKLDQVKTTLNTYVNMPPHSANAATPGSAAHLPRDDQPPVPEST